METPDSRQSLYNAAHLTESIPNALGEFAIKHPYPPALNENRKTSSAVMFLIGLCSMPAKPSSAPCLILNKRSDSVRQPGDLCFPGGGISPWKDRFIAAVLHYLWVPMKQRALLPYLKHTHRTQRKNFVLHLAVALREAWEEMRLNPFRVKLLGYLPVQRLQVIDRTIWPVVGCLSRQCRFTLNWEVQRVVYISLKSLLDPGNYARFQPMIKAQGQGRAKPLHDNLFPCFVHGDGWGQELLWGASFRMVADFLRIVFKFEVPPMNYLPKIEGFLSPNYLQATPMAHHWQPGRKAD